MMPASQGLTRRPLLILIALFLLSLPLVTTRIYASDEVQYLSYLRSLWFDRDVSFENEYQHFYDSGVVHYPGFHETFLERQTETGRRITFATMGSALLWSPFYAVRRGLPHDYPEVEATVMVVRHRLTLLEVPARMREREHGRSSITALRSLYYVVKVLLALFIGLFRRRVVPLEEA